MLLLKVRTLVIILLMSRQHLLTSCLRTESVKTFHVPGCRSPAQRSHKQTSFNWNNFWHWHLVFVILFFFSLITIKKKMRGLPLLTDVLLRYWRIPNVTARSSFNSPQERFWNLRNVTEHPPKQISQWLMKIQCCMWKQECWSESSSQGQII